MGNKTLRTAILLVVLLCGQALGFAHAFEQPVALGHVDHACLTCAHGYFGGAPPSQPSSVAVVATLQLAPAPILSGDRRPFLDACHPTRAPPTVLV